MFRVGLHNFSKGEIGPQLYGRVDVAAYSSAVRLARNVVVLKYGGLQRRMGQRVVYEIAEPASGWDDPDSAARLFPFEFSIEQTYALLFTQAVMRPMALGGAVLEAEELAITGVTREAQAVITSPFHGYAAGDEWFPVGIFGTMGDLLNGRAWRIVAVIDAHNFRIDADTRDAAPFSGASGGTLRTEAPPPPPSPPVVPPPVEPPPPPPVSPPAGGGGGLFDPNVSIP